MLHHLSLAVTDLHRATRFYDAVLTPLGYARVFTGDAAVGYGYAGKDDLLLLNLQDEANIPGEGFHLAFAAKAPEDVACFHAAALRHGGRCNGPPGLRADYGAHYYAAFVIDPEGYRIEAVINPASPPG
jgi:catechol 2,3-dioxygenase-like lactoylglutathione lyase family enzyme